MNVEEKMITVENALDVLHAKLARIQMPCVALPVQDAEGHVLREAVRSKVSLPPFNKSAMDGYAVCEGDIRACYRVLEVVSAGEVPRAELIPGTAVKVMTGAPVPQGAGKVIMVEHTREENGEVEVFERSAATNICAKGEDVSEGERILESGRRLHCVDVANLLACGIERVQVSSPITACIFSTGNEVVTTWDEMKPGKIFDTNTPMLSSLCRSNGVRVLRNAVLPDDREVMAKAMQEAEQACDLILISGGVSAGDFDYVAEALEDCGFTIHFSRVAIKPGKPTTFATRGETVACGLPGNPVSVHLTFHVFVRRAIALMRGETSREPVLRLTLRSGLKRKKDERVEFRPCRIGTDMQVEPVDYHGSAHFLALRNAQGYFMIPQGVKEIPAGGSVRFLSIPEMMQ